MKNMTKLQEAGTLVEKQFVRVHIFFDIRFKALAKLNLRKFKRAIFVNSVITEIPFQQFM